jgi:hypothetical protein
MRAIRPDHGPYDSRISFLHGKSTKAIMGNRFHVPRRNVQGSWTLCFSAQFFSWEIVKNHMVWGFILVGTMSPVLAQYNGIVDFTFFSSVFFMGHPAKSGV